MCKTELTALFDIAKLGALNDEQRAFVVEACLGYYILNEPPDELVRVVRGVSDKFADLIKHSNVDAVGAVRYIASTNQEFFGVLEELPATDWESAQAQVLRALGSSSIAVQLNVHRTLVKYISGMMSHKVFPGSTQRVRKIVNKQGTPTDRYGAVEHMGIVALHPTTQVHVPASSQVITTGPAHPYDMPAVSGPSGTTDILMKVTLALKLSRPEQRWYCLGILGFLLAPGAHSLHEVALVVGANDVAEYLPCYRYCGFLGFEMQQAVWYKPLLNTFGCSLRFGYWGDLEQVCYLLVKQLKLGSELASLVFSFLELPFLPPSSWSPMLQSKLLT